ncbi:hypothetical protein SAMN02745866_00021 [Alteromonadaceae bacterium Bs31]|nr:hypothetical protein SAMN02745866_00021 [Alteromonadaceae bacterium Bs31]
MAFRHIDMQHKVVMVAHNSVGADVNAKQLTQKK